MCFFYISVVCCHLQGNADITVCTFCVNILCKAYYLFQMKPTVCTLLVGVFISTALHVSWQLSAHHQNLLYLRDTGIFHSVWVAVWSAGWDDQSHPNQHTRQPPIHSEKYQCPRDTVRSHDDGHLVA